MKKRIMISCAYALFLGFSPALYAQTATPADKPATDEAQPTTAAAKPKAAKPMAKSMKMPASVLVKITNTRSVAVTELVITLSGAADSAGTIKPPLAPGKSVSLKINTKKSCTFDVRGTYEDEATIEADSVNFCTDPKLVLKD